MVTREEASRWLAAYGRAWQTGDAQRILALFTDDASHRETPFDAPMIGHDASRHYWLDQPAKHRDVHFSFEIWTVVGDQCFSHWNCGFVKEDRRLELDGAFRLIFQGSTREGPLCRTLEEWWHQRQTS